MRLMGPFDAVAEPFELLGCGVSPAKSALDRVTSIPFKVFSAARRSRALWARSGVHPAAGVLENQQQRF